MMNKATWLGIGIMVATVLLFLGDIVTDYVRPLLPWIAAAGAVLFAGGLAYARIRARTELDTGVSDEPAERRAA